MEKIFLLGPDSPVKQLVWEALRQRQAGSGADQKFICPQQADELTQEASALIFGSYASGNRSENLQWPEELMGTIEEVQRVRPRRLLFISDTMVYGKLFGEQRLLREDELGYVCHTAADGMTAQWMRFAEHLCARLAREENLPVKIVRVDWTQILAENRSPGDLGTIIESMLGILETGPDGEAYNLSVLISETLTEKNAECAHRRRPLTPITVLLDTGKAEKYAAS